MRSQAVQIIFIRTPSQIHKALDYCASPSLLHLFSCSFVLIGTDQRIGWSNESKLGSIKLVNPDCKQAKLS